MSDPEVMLARSLRHAYGMAEMQKRTLRWQLAAAPHDAYRELLVRHLAQTRAHAARVRSRLRAVEVGLDGTRTRVVVGLVVGNTQQALAIRRSVLDRFRLEKLEERVLREAEERCAVEAHELATYRALQRLAQELGDTTTEHLASTICDEEAVTLAALLGHIPALVSAVAVARDPGDTAHDPTTTGARVAGRRAVRPAGLDRTATRDGAAAD